MKPSRCTLTVAVALILPLSTASRTSMASDRAARGIAATIDRLLERHVLAPLRTRYPDAMKRAGQAHAARKFCSIAVADPRLGPVLALGARQPPALRVALHRAGRQGALKRVDWPQTIGEAARLLVETWPSVSDSRALVTRRQREDAALMRRLERALTPTALDYYEDYLERLRLQLSDSTRKLERRIEAKELSIRMCGPDDIQRTPVGEIFLAQTKSAHEARQCQVLRADIDILQAGLAVLDEYQRVVDAVREQRSQAQGR